MKRVRTQRKPAGGSSSGGGRGSAAPVATRREREAATAGPTVDVSSHDPRGLFALQRVIGNQAIGNMLREPPSSVEQGAPAQTSVSQATVAPASFARKLGASTSSAMQHISLSQRAARRGPQGEVLRRLAASGQNQAAQTLARRNGSRTSGGKRNPGRGAATASQPQIQRLVMSNQQWKSKSASKSLPIRSPKLLQIDLMLMAYNAVQQKTRNARSKALKPLEDAIRDWMSSKDVQHTEGHGRSRVHVEMRQGREHRRIKSPRVAAVRALRKQVRSERVTLDGLEVGKVDTSTGVQTVVRSIYRRAVRVAQNIVAKRGSAADLLDDLAKATRDAKSLAKKAGSVKGSAIWADTLVDALKGFNLIANDKAPDFSGPESRRTRSAPGLGQFVKAVETDLERLDQVASAARKEPESKSSAVEGAPVEIGSQTMGGVEAGLDIHNMQSGTGGKSNEGFDTLGSALGETKTDDLTSARDDMIGALMGTGVDLISLKRALKTLRQRPKASAKERRDAKLVRAQAGPKAVAAVMKFSGAQQTGQKGSGKAIKGAAGFTASGTNVSTDLKFAGDIFGQTANFMGFIGKFLDLFHHGKDKSAKQQARAGGMEDAGAFFKKFVDMCTAGLNTAKGVTKLAFQASGGGQQQVADPTKAAIKGAVTPAADTFMKTVVPIVNVIKTLLDTAQQVYKLWSIWTRRSALDKKIKVLIGKAGTDLPMVEAVELVRVSLSKRIDRIGLNLGHALLGVTAAILNTSGVGMAPGLVTNLASSAAKLGQFGGRTAKQAARNAWARKRERRASEGKAKYAGKDYAETYEHFKARKRQAAGKGKFARMKVAFKLTFMLNWDKSGKKKKQDATAVALELLRMNDRAIFKALGITDELKAAMGVPAKRMKIVVAALKKRD